MLFLHQNAAKEGARGSGHVAAVNVPGYRPSVGAEHLSIRHLRSAASAPA